ncbi:MAG: type I restriction endonuclease [Acidiferrobacteraceae bacterium]
MSADKPDQPNLATFRKFIGRLPASWPTFLRQRQSRLAQQARNGVAAEKVAENILEDFFTIALDWTIGDLNNQLQYADIVLTSRGIKHLLIEVKRPGSLRWDQTSLEQALSQARRYADEQRVRTIAVSDGTLFYAADIVNGGLQHRARLLLDVSVYSPDAWWVSVDGIYRPPMRLAIPEAAIEAESLEKAADSAPQPEAIPTLLHPKYKVPAECFAYVGDASKTVTWKLPYRNTDGSVDEKHLSGAIRAVVTNYRGAHVKTVPDAAIADVLVRLGRAAAEIRKLPGQTPAPLESYRLLHDALRQVGRLDEVL